MSRSETQVNLRFDLLHSPFLQTLLKTFPLSLQYTKLPGKLIGLIPGKTVPYEKIAIPPASDHYRNYT